jgi:hypothetical protein
MSLPELDGRKKQERAGSAFLTFLLGFDLTIGSGR